jgi:hypothetical protein
LLPFIFDMATVQKLSWKEIQNYGGIKFEQPMESDDGYYLPLVCNVSGLDSITRGSTAVSSYNVYKRTKVKIDDHMIYVDISISGPFMNDNGTQCKAVKLGKLDHGHYLVYYASGELIGDFNI